jgi:hypothetical protein
VSLAIKCTYDTFESQKPKTFFNPETETDPDRKPLFMQKTEPEGGLVKKCFQGIRQQTALLSAEGAKRSKDVS